MGGTSREDPEILGIPVFRTLSVKGYVGGDNSGGSRDT